MIKNMFTMPVVENASRIWNMIDFSSNHSRNKQIEPSLFYLATLVLSQKGKNMLVQEVLAWNDINLEDVFVNSLNTS